MIEQYKLLISISDLYSIAEFSNLMEINYSIKDIKKKETQQIEINFFENLIDYPKNEKELKTEFEELEKNFFIEFKILDKENFGELKKDIDILQEIFRTRLEDISSK